MPKNPEPPLYFVITPSRHLRVASSSLYILALSACWLNGLPTVFRLLFSCLLIALWLRSGKACKATGFYLRYTGSQGWAVSSDGQNYLIAVIKASTVIGEMATFLHFSTENKSFGSLLILKDALSADDYRRLVVGLKLSGYGQD